MLLLFSFPKAYISFEGRTETSIEVLTSVCAVFADGCMRDFSLLNVQFFLCLRVYRKRLRRG